MIYYSERFDEVEAKLEEISEQLDEILEDNE